MPRKILPISCSNFVGHVTEVSVGDLAWSPSFWDEKHGVNAHLPHTEDTEEGTNVDPDNHLDCSNEPVNKVT